eukprot:181016_1
MGKMMLLFVVIYVIGLVKSISVCDDLDILLFFDASTINNRGNDISRIIDTLVYDGANEHSGFAVIVYGELDSKAFKKDDDIILISTKDSSKIHRKKKKQKFIEDNLDLDSFAVSGEETKFISLNDAIEIAMSHKTMENEHVDELIVFEYDDSMVTNDENCNILQEYIGRIHFVFEDITDFEGCERIADEDEDHSYSSFDDVSENIESLFRLTCPTTINDPDPQSDEKLKLTTKGNWIEIDTIISCELFFDDDGGLTDLSTINVMDDVNDDATYKVGDILLVREKELDLLPPECQYPIYKINYIEYGNGENELVLYVKTVSLLSYMTEAHVHKDNTPLKKTKSKNDNVHHDKDVRRLASASLTGSVEAGASWSDSGVTAGVTASASISASLSFDYCIACFPPRITELSLTITGSASFTPYIRVDVSSSKSKSWSKKGSKQFTFFIYGVPVVLRPYVEGTVTVGVGASFKMDLSFPIKSSYTLGISYHNGFSKSWSKPSLPEIDPFDKLCGASVTLSGSIAIEVGLTLYELLSGYLTGTLSSENSVGCPGCVSTANTFSMIIGGRIRDDYTGFTLIDEDLGTATVINSYSLYSKTWCLSAKINDAPKMIGNPYVDDNNINVAKDLDGYETFNNGNYHGPLFVELLVVLIGILILVNIIMIVHYYCCNFDNKQKQYSMVNVTSDVTSDDEH